MVFDGIPRFLMSFRGISAFFGDFRVLEAKMEQSPAKMKSKIKNLFL